MVQFHTPVRSTSKLLVDAAAAKPVAAAQHPSAPMQTMLDTTLGFMQQFTAPPSANKANGAPHIHIFHPSSRPAVMPDSAPGAPSLTLLLQSGGSEASSPMTTVKAQVLTHVSEFKPKMRLPLIDHVAKQSSHQKQSPPSCPVQKEAIMDIACAKPQMSLQDYEQLAFEHLNKKKKSTTDEPGPKAPKQRTASSKQKARQPSNGLKLGCPRCRGSVNGCSTCRSENYNGIRLHGKAEYEKHHKASKRTRITK